MQMPEDRINTGFLAVHPLSMANLKDCIFYILPVRLLIIGIVSLPQNLLFTHRRAESRFAQDR